MKKKSVHSSGTTSNVKRLSSGTTSKVKKPKVSVYAPSKRKTSSSSSRSSSKFVCSICFDDKPKSDRFRTGKCDHKFCIECISKYVGTQLQQNIIKMTCPNPNCSKKLKPNRFRGILPDEVILRWESVKYESLIAASDKTYCPFKDCSMLLVDDGGEVVTSAECPSCHRLFCAQCRVPWHGDKTCLEFQLGKENTIENKLDDKFFKLARVKKWQKCPKCTMFVQRRSGCELIKCRCGVVFCYHCGKKCGYGHVCVDDRY